MSFKQCVHCIQRLRLKAQSTLKCLTHFALFEWQQAIPANTKRTLLQLCIIFRIMHSLITSIGLCLIVRIGWLLSQKQYIGFVCTICAYCTEWANKPQLLVFAVHFAFHSIHFHWMWTFAIEHRMQTIAQVWYSISAIAILLTTTTKKHQFWSKKCRCTWFLKLFF